jgi:hypothetical protein
MPFEKQIHDYANVSIPDTKNPKQYTTAERRADEYQLLKQTGTFSSLNTITLGKKYGLTPMSISRDRQVLMTYVNNFFNNSENVIKELFSVKLWALETARRSNDYKSASIIADSILEMAFNLGKLEKSAVKLDMKLSEEYVSLFKPRPREGVLFISNSALKKDKSNIV